MHKGEYLDCEVLFVMIYYDETFKYLENIFHLALNLFGLELFTFSWDFIDSDN